MVGLPVLGLKHVPRHVLDRHMSEHVLVRHVLGHVLGIKKQLFFQREKIYHTIISFCFIV